MYYCYIFIMLRRRPPGDPGPQGEFLQQPFIRFGRVLQAVLDSDREASIYRAEE